MQKILIILCLCTITACANQHYFQSGNTQKHKTMPPNSISSYRTNSNNDNQYTTEPMYENHQYGTELRAIDQELQQLNSHDGMHDAERVNLQQYRQGLINQENKDCQSGTPGITKCNQ